MHLSHVILYIHNIQLVQWLWRRSISLTTSQITWHIFYIFYSPSIHASLIQVLSSNITLQCHHGVTKSHSRRRFTFTVLLSLNTSVLVNIPRTNPRASHEATPSRTSALRWPIKRPPLSTWRLLQSRRPTFFYGNQSGIWHSVQVRSDAKSHIIPNAIINHKTCICYTCTGCIKKVTLLNVLLQCQFARYHKQKQIHH